MILKSVATLLAFLVAPLSFYLPNKHGDEVNGGAVPLGWTYFQVAPVGWHYVSSKGGVDTFFRSEGKPAMDTMMLCSGLDFQFRKVAANTFCTSPNEAANITAVLSTPSEPGDTTTPLLQRAIITSHLPLNQVPQPTIHIQPPKGWAFIGVDTILYLTYPNPDQTINIGGVPGQLTWQVAYHDIDFGQGPNQHLQTGSDGAPYPDQTITHVYEEPGTVTPQVTTTWNAIVNIAGNHFRFDEITTTHTTGSELTLRKPQIRLVNPDRTPNE